MVGNRYTTRQNAQLDESQTKVDARPGTYLSSVKNNQSKEPFSSIQRNSQLKPTQLATQLQRNSSIRPKQRPKPHRVRRLRDGQVSLRSDGLDNPVDVVDLHSASGQPAP